MTSTARPSSPAGAAGSASRVPLIIGLAAVLVSLVLAVIVIVGFSATVKIAVLPLPLVIAEHWWLSFVGYLLTPAIVIVCLGWDAIAQRRGLRRNANFAGDVRYSAVLRWATYASLVLGIWHILNLSVPLSEALGLS